MQFVNCEVRKNRFYLYYQDRISEGTDCLKWFVNCEVRKKRCTLYMEVMLGNDTLMMPSLLK